MLNRRRWPVLALVLICVAAAAVVWLFQFKRGSASPPAATPSPVPMQKPNPELQKLGSAPPPELHTFKTRGRIINQDSSYWFNSDYIYSQERAGTPGSGPLTHTMHCFDLTGKLHWSSELDYFTDVLDLRDGRRMVGQKMAGLLLDPAGRVLHQEKLGDGHDHLGEMVEAPSGNILGLLNRTTLCAFSSRGKLLWKHGPGPHQSVERPVVAADGTILVGHESDLIALSPKGRELWKRSFRSRARPRLVDKLVLVEADETTIEAVDVKTGETRWRDTYPDHTPEDKYLQHGAGAAGPVYFWEFQGGMRALDRASGKLLWTFKELTEEHGQQWGLWDCAVDEAGNVYAVLNEQLVSLDPAGNVRFRIGGERTHMTGLQLGKSYVLVDSETAPPQDVIDAAVAEWKKETEGMSDDERHNTWPKVPPSEKHTYCFDLATGQLLWDLPVDKDSIWRLQARGDAVLRVEYPQDDMQGDNTIHVWQR